MKTGHVIIDCDNVQVNYWYAQDPAWLHSDQGLEMHQWCYEQWGPSELVKPEPGWSRMSLDTFMFNSQEKMIAFVMRWG